MTFDRTIKMLNGKDETEYGIIDGSNIIVFIKAGLLGNCYGYENKYLQIGRNLNEKYGCSVISASNPSGYGTDFSAEMSFVRDYADRLNLSNYRIHYFGHSNGAALGIINAYKYSEIQKLVCVNAPLIINPHLLIQGIKNFSEGKIHLVYGSKDPSFKMLKLFSELESDKIRFTCINGADHDFTGCLDLFISLPEMMFLEKGN